MHVVLFLVVMGIVVWVTLFFGAPDLPEIPFPGKKCRL